MVFTQHLRVLDCAVLRHTMLMCFTIGRQPHRIIFNGTGVGALPNKLPEDRMACAFVYLYEGTLCVSNGHKLPFFCRRLPWCAMEVTGTLRDG